MDLIETTRRYFAALEEGATGDALAAFYSADTIQEEFPTRLSPSGVRRNLAEILEAAERGKQAMASQRYEIVNIVASGDCVAIEFRWTGILAVPIGSLPAGFEMRGRFASFIEFEGGSIVRQRSYDCFEPW
jgi:ketosteroid isomerase-like protein